MCHSFSAALNGRSSSALPSGDKATKKPAGCSSASSEAVRPACARRAAINRRLPGAADLKRFGHGAEIGDQACGHRGGNRHCGRNTGSIEAAQFGARRGCGDWPEHRRRVPALAMQRHWLAFQKFGPDLVACDIGRQHLGAARSARLALREDRRHQHGARMAVERNVVVVQNVRGNAIDQRRGFDRAPARPME